MHLILTEGEVSQVIKVIPPLPAKDSVQQEVTSRVCFWEQSSQRARAGLPGAVGPYLLDLCLQVAQLHALLQVLAVLLRRHVQLLLLLVQELQQVLHASGHVHVPVAEQLHTCNRDSRNE